MSAAGTPLRQAARRALLRLRWRGRLELGRGACVGRGVRFELDRGARLVLGEGARLGDRSSVRARGEVRIGTGTLIGRRSVLAANELVSIGESCLLGDETMLSDTALTVEAAARPGGERAVTVRPVRVGDRVRIGPRACLLAGASVGEGAIIGPRSVVDGPVAEGAVVGGVPARAERRQVKGGPRPGGSTR